MGLIDSITGFLGDEAPEQYHYQCTVCRTTFDATESDPSAVACDACGARSVRALGRG